MQVEEIKGFLGKTDMYLIDLLQKGYLDHSGTVIDVGCGTGRNLKLFKDLGWTVTAMDANPVVFESDYFLRNKSEIDIRVGELGKIEDALSSFDFVICNAVLHFAEDLDHFKSMFYDLIRLQKENGVIFCRFVSSDTLGFRKGEMNQVRKLKDGSNRFVVDFEWLISEFLSKQNVTFLEVPKTVNVAGKRSMTTLVLRAK